LEPVSAKVVVATPEEKWKANQDKVAFMKQFPGLLSSWEQTVGQKVTTVTPLRNQSGTAVLTFANDTFAVVGHLTPEPRVLAEAIPAIQGYLKTRYPEAYAHYQVLAETDREAARQARLQNIIGAIHNNLEEIPELRDRLRTLVQEWNS